MATTETDRPAAVQGEVRMLIDGELVEASSGKTFDNINPATEEVLGPVADASAEDMQRAIAAARRAFDETDWSTNHAFRKECLLQLQAAIDLRLLVRGGGDRPGSDAERDRGAHGERERRGHAAAAHARHRAVGSTATRWGYGSIGDPPGRISKWRCVAP